MQLKFLGCFGSFFTLQTVVFLLSGVSHFVGLQANILHEGLSTVNATKGLLSSMGPLMPLKFWGCFESFVTLQTFISLLPSVSNFVGLQVTRL